MIGYLKGTVISSKPTRITLDVNGVGYLVNISINTFEKISDLPEVSLFIYTSVKEDSITLFGFFTETEKEMFELLISVNGIGPKIALGVLSGIKTDDLKTAIYSSDVSRIVSVPGIGRKTAERMVLELKSKIDSVAVDKTNQKPDIRSEAVSALTTLGYNSRTAEKITSDVLSELPAATIEELIRRSLALLNKS
jgi:holliday junction DNA helicase RuvA